jgi:hypothetical protein
MVPILTGHLIMNSASIAIKMGFFFQKEMEEVQDASGNRLIEIEAPEFLARYLIKGHNIVKHWE